MNWQDLNVFLTLARNGRVNPAAKALNMDATTLVRRVKKLEEDLNCSLFELTSKGYQLTGAGEKITGHLQLAEQQILQAKHSVTGQRSALAGSIRISAPEGFGCWILAPALADFKQQYPAISVELVATSGLLNVNKREADMAVLLERPAKGLLYTRKLSPYSLRLYGQRDYLAQHQRINAISQLRNHKLISYIPDLLYTSQLKFVEEAALSTTRSLHSTSINAQLQMALAGAGLCILPCFIADQQPQLAPVLPRQIHIERSFWLATHRDVRHLARSEAFIQWLLACIEDRQPLLLGEPH